ncbi:uncharacterized protein LOC144282510 isoform X2 [Canis aureus]
METTIVRPLRCASASGTKEYGDPNFMCFEDNPRNNPRIGLQCDSRTAGSWEKCMNIFWIYCSDTSIEDCNCLEDRLGVYIIKISMSMALLITEPYFPLESSLLVIQVMGWTCLWLHVIL